MSHNRGKLTKAVFCPWCGVGGVVRDDYQNPNNCKVEFICPTCGASYRLLDSTRRQVANHLFAEDRRLRLPSKAKERYRMLCAQMFKQFKRYYRDIAKTQTRDAFKAWFNSEQAGAARHEMEIEKEGSSKC